MLWLCNFYQVQAQVIIKEKAELKPDTIANDEGHSISALELPEITDGTYYPRLGGTLKLETSTSFFLAYTESWDIQEESFGSIGELKAFRAQRDSANYTAGSLDQWEALRFHLTGNESGETKKMLTYEPIEILETRQIVKFEKIRHYYWFNLWTGGPTFRYWNPGIRFIIEPDSILAQIAPPEILELLGNPYEPSEQISVEDSIYVSLTLRDTSHSSTHINLFWEREAGDSLLVENAREQVGNTIPVGKMQPGDLLRFYITSDAPAVEGQKLYPETITFTAEERINQGHNNLAVLNFEDWTDLYFNDLEVEVNFRKPWPDRPEEIVVEANPDSLEPEEAAVIHLSQKNSDHSVEPFPEDQLFQVSIAEEDRPFAAILSPEGDTVQNGGSVLNDFFISLNANIGDTVRAIAVDFEVTTQLAGEYTHSISGDGFIPVQRELEGLEVTFEPNVIGLSDTANIIVRGVLEDGTTAPFAADQLFTFVIVEGDTNGTLISPDGQFSSDNFFGVPQGVKFVSEEMIDTDTVTSIVFAETYQEIIVIPTKVSSSASDENENDSKSIRQKSRKIIKHKAADSNDNVSFKEGIVQPNTSATGPMGNVISADTYANGSGEILITEKSPCEEEARSCTPEDLQPQKLDTDQQVVGPLDSSQDIIFNNPDGSLAMRRIGSQLRTQACDPDSPGRLGFSTGFLKNAIQFINIDACLNEAGQNWVFKVDNLNIPIVNYVCPREVIPIQGGEFVAPADLKDGTDPQLLATHIQNQNDYNRVVDALKYWKDGSYRTVNGELTVKPPPNEFIFEAGIKTHEYKHYLQLKELYEEKVNVAYQNIYDLQQLATVEEDSCANEAINKFRDFKKGKGPLGLGTVVGIDFLGVNNSLDKARKDIDDLREQDKLENEEDADEYARSTYEQIRLRIEAWAETQPWN